jgi:hypothetical protein
MRDKALLEALKMEVARIAEEILAVGFITYSNRISSEKV